MEKTEIKNLKKGDFFKREIKGQPSAKVYIKGAYDKAEKAYLCTAYDDINEWLYIKPNKAVFYGFTF